MTDIVEFPNIYTKIPIKKIAMLTDIHFGRKGNSPLHNQDCLDFIDFFCEEVKKDKDITQVFFMGDWYENRNSVNISTLNYSHVGLKKLDSLGLEIFFKIGNHDLFHRNHREVHSAVGFNVYNNIHVIEHPTVLNEMFLLCPYIFGTEYGNLIHYNYLPYFAGHFEFKSFIMQGSSILEHGPDHRNFNGPKYIFSGHYHKRQFADNVIYIGNTFPLDFGDTGDIERGMAVVDVRTDEVYFLNWDDCPKYLRTKLSNVLEGDFIAPKKTRVRCLVDVDLSYSDAQDLKIGMLNEFNLREFTLEENMFEKKTALTEGGTEVELDDFELSSIDEMVISLLETVNETTNINPKKLTDIYRSL